MRQEKKVALENVKKILKKPSFYTFINACGPNTRLVQNTCFISLLLPKKRRHVTHHVKKNP